LAGFAEVLDVCKKMVRPRAVREIAPRDKVSLESQVILVIQPGAHPKRRSSGERQQGRRKVAIAKRRKGLPAGGGEFSYETQRK